jgi:hypothetical protein
MEESMNDEKKTDALTGLALLRAPFPDNQISKLPKPTRKRDFMDTLPKAKCNVCGGYHATTNIIHLDYVGHAALTDRLLDADQNWNWEPLSVDGDGLPLRDKDGGLWIKLTVCGVTRLGYGGAEGKTGIDASKELIGDCLRNAAMRFGAALDLWHKGQLHPDEELPPETPTKPAAKQPAKKQGEPPADVPQEKLTPDKLTEFKKQMENATDVQAAWLIIAAHCTAAGDSEARKHLKDYLINLLAQRAKAAEREPGQEG